MRKVVGLLALGIIVAGSVSTARAQEGRIRVIVQLADSAIAEDGRAPEQAASPDARAWPYHDRRVIGAIQALERRHGGVRAQGFYTHALRGFFATVTRAQAAALAADPAVKLVEQEQLVSLPPISVAAQTIPWGITTIGADVSTQQSGDGAGTVSGVNVYVIDTGVDPTHPDLNVVNHVTFVGAPNADCHGHGTGVAGIIAAKDNGDYVVGVAPGAPVTGVKVMTCEGFSFPSFIIQGVDWVTANAVKPAVANMSLGSLITLTSLNDAVSRSAASGVFYAIAAGNGNPFTGAKMNACTVSPAGAGADPSGFPNGVMTVAATDMAEQEASFSNYGPCVDIWAPGVAITSTWLMSAGGLITASGTSFASPYTAGAAALVLAQYPTIPNWLLEWLLEYVADVPGSVSEDGAAIRRLTIRYF
jgi:subtilisin family serine protease